METEKCKLKVGDKVRVKSKEWYQRNKDDNGDVIKSWRFIFLKEMEKYCGQVIEITETYEHYYRTNSNNYIWQDWMLEEFNGQNKISNMETKKMTLQEAQEFVNNTKFICTSVEETKRVQIKLFELGIEWAGERADVNEDAFLLFVEDYKLLFDGDISYWMTAESRRIEPSEILAIEIKQETKPKFDPSTLKPFDKVLVRRNANSVWLARFFEYNDYVDYHVTNAGAWKFCIPYNDETKHLHRTNNEAPEFYKQD